MDITRYPVPRKEFACLVLLSPLLLPPPPDSSDLLRNWQARRRDLERF